MKNTIEKINKLILSGEYYVQISSVTDVYVDDYERGELDHRNYWENDTLDFYEIKENLSDTLNDKIKYYIESILYAEYNQEWLKDVLCNYYDDYFYYNNFVNVDNETPTEKEVELWRNGKVELFNQTICITIKINGVLIPTNILFELLFDKDD